MVRTFLLKLKRKQLCESLITKQDGYSYINSTQLYENETNKDEQKKRKNFFALNCV